MLHSVRAAFKRRATSDYAMSHHCDIIRAEPSDYAALFKGKVQALLEHGG